MLWILLTVAMLASTGWVTAISTVSGLAPGYVVMIITYGRLILGSRSAVILVKDTTPRTMANTTPTNTVYGFFTLNFDIIMPPTASISQKCFYIPSDWSVSFILLII